MCEQCSAATQRYVGTKDEDVLSGYSLVRATKDGRFMKEGDWGLVQQNNPDYWWQVTPVEDPDFGLTDEQIDALPDDGYNARYGLFDVAVENLEDALCGRTKEIVILLGNAWERGHDYSGCPHFENAIDLYNASVKAGYDLEVHGYRFACWLCNHIAKFLKTAKVEKQ